MFIEQTVEIHDDRRLVLNLPEGTPAGRAKAAVTLVFETGGTDEKPDMLSYRTGFMKGQISVPPDFDTMGQAEIAALKTIQTEQIKNLLRNDDPVLRRYTNRAQDLREARVAIAFRHGKPHDDQSYAKHAGCLKDSGVFAGDSAVIQEEMRREWM